MEALSKGSFRHAAVHVINNADITGRNTDGTEQGDNDAEDDDKGRDNCANGFVHWKTPLFFELLEEADDF